MKAFYKVRRKSDGKCLTGLKDFTADGQLFCRKRIEKILNSDVHIPYLVKHHGQLELVKFDLTEAPADNLSKKMIQRVKEEFLATVK